MEYTLHFYALNPKATLDSLDDPSLPSRLLSQVAASGRLDEQELVLLEETLLAGLRGEWPVLETNEAFVALDWLLDFVAERLPLDDFVAFKPWSLWQSTGLADEFKKVPAPFPIPTSRPDGTPLSLPTFPSRQV